MIANWNTVPAEIRRRFRGIEDRCAAKFACGKWYIRVGRSQSTMFVRRDGSWVLTMTFIAMGEAE